MSADDRDAKFEKALSRHLRAECPDVETLAAYHERSLAPGEMMHWKTHIAGCGLCQEILSQLEATEHLRVDASERSSALDRQMQAVGASLQAASGAAKEAQRPPAPLGKAAPSPRVVSMPRRGTPWKWAGPAGAVAAGLLVWLAVNEMRQPKLVTQAPVQVAENRPAPKLPAPAAQSKSEPSPEESLDRTAATNLAMPDHGKKAVPTAPERGRAPSRNGELAKVQARVAKKAPAPQVADNFEDRLQAGAEAKEQAQAKNAPASEPKGEAAGGFKPIAAATESVQVEASAATAPAPPSAPAARDEKTKQAAGLASAQRASGGAVGGLAEASSGYRKENLLRTADASSVRSIFSSDGKASWRVGENGLILHSDGGSAEWTAQASGVSAELTAGSAPTEKICWVVGRAGTILRTTDGGEHWRKIPSPIAADLGGIRAADEAHAVIWDSANRLAYQTEDGGKTWKPVSNP